MTDHLFFCAEKSKFFFILQGQAEQFLRSGHTNNWAVLVSRLFSSNKIDRFSSGAIIATVIQELCSFERNGKNSFGN